MESRPLLFLLAGLALNAQAATVAPDSLVCESVSDLEYVSRQDHLKGRPGSEVIKSAKASIEGARIYADMSRQIRLPKRRSDEVEKAEDDANKSVVSGCAAFGGPAVVLERKAISGLAKVRVTYEGKPAELWTQGSRVTD